MTRKPTAARIALAAAFIVLALALVPVALAGKGAPNNGGGKGGGGGGSTSGSSSSLTGPVMVIDNNGDGLPNHGDSITFNVSTTATASPEVGVRCYQGSTFVYDGYVGYWPGYMFTPYFTLSSQSWVSGAATCTARLFHYDNRGREVVLATLGFSVAA
jgi:hypothetical protein